MATNPFAVPTKKKVAYKNPFGVNVKSSSGNDNGIYNPQDGGWGNDTQHEEVEDFPQFGSNNNGFNSNNNFSSNTNTNNNSFNNFNNNSQQSQKFPQNNNINGFDNKKKQQQMQPFKPVPQQNPFPFNPNNQQQQQQQQNNNGGNLFDNSTNLDMNFSMDENPPAKQKLVQQTSQPKRFDPNQFQQQQQQMQQQQYQQSYQHLGFDPNNVDPDNEPPLLVELGIDLNSIKVRTLSVLKFQKCDIRFLEDPDMSGPIILGFLFGFFLLLSGKMHFGYIYGFGISGTLAIYCIMNFLSMHKEIPLYNTLSILGYCLMPVIILSFINVFMSLKGLTGGILSTSTILWSTIAATNFFNELIHQEHQKYLVAYPILLFYSMFVLLTIF